MRTPIRITTTYFTLAIFVLISFTVPPLALFFIVSVFKRAKSKDTVIIDRHREEDWVLKRRRLLNIAHSAPLKGLALSGGGIRSAFIARGFVDKLASADRFNAFDYVSAVSGGAYTAASILDAAEIGENLPLSAKYEKKSPDVSYVGLWSLVWDSLFNLFPVILFLAFLQEVAILKVDGNSHFAILFVIASIVAFGLFYGKLSNSSKRNSNAFFLAKCALGLAIFLSISFVASAAIRSALHVIFAAALMAVPIIIFHHIKEATPHRTASGSSLALPYTWIAIFAILSVILNKLLRRTGEWVFSHITWFPYSAKTFNFYVWFMLYLIAILLLIYQTRVDRVNKSNWLFNGYRKNLGARFMPHTAGRRFFEMRLKEHPTPFPIINATLTDGVDRDVFEISPLTSRSIKKERSRTSSWLPNLTLAEAVAVSGSALDALGVKMGLKSVLGLVIAGTGYWLPQSADLRKQRLAVFMSHLAIAMGLRAKVVHRLTDGGFAENLGVAALLDRRVDSIFCLDAEYDPNYDFDGLRNLVRMANTDFGAQISLADFAGVPDTYRLMQNDTSIIQGQISYADKGENYPKKTGTYIHIKINNSMFNRGCGFSDFPHYPTADQRLDVDPIEALYELGESLAQECIDKKLL